MKIGHHDLNEDGVFIIAEAGVNHNGSLEIAKQLVDAAKAAGANAVKFQWFNSEQLATNDAELAEYQRKNSAGKTQKEMLQKLELSAAQFAELKQYCDVQGMMFLATPFDEQSAELLAQLNVPAFKISSGDLTYHALLKKITSYGRPMIISTGMATLGDMESTLHALRESRELIVWMHCTSAYPAPYDTLHLRTIHTLNSAFGGPIGYSDHSLGIEVPIAAVALGYRLIEKHFTLDRTMAGPDHKASLEPNELKQMVQSIRNVEKALGGTSKFPDDVEQHTAKVVRRGIYLNKDVQPGHRIKQQDLLFLRPLSALSAAQYEDVLGKKMVRPKRKNEPLRWSDME